MAYSLLLHILFIWRFFLETQGSVLTADSSKTEQHHMPYYEALIQRSILIEKSPLNFVFDGVNFAELNETLTSELIGLANDHCTLEIRTDSCQGYEMPTAKPGQKLCFVWNCTKIGDKYSMRVEHCNVISPFTGHKIPLIDANGCGTSLLGMLIMGTPIYSQNLKEAYHEMHMLRFADGQDSAKFECQIRICDICNCSDLLPPHNCSDVDQFHSNTHLNQSHAFEQCRIKHQYLQSSANAGRSQRYLKNLAFFIVFVLLALI